MSIAPLAYFLKYGIGAIREKVNHDLTRRQYSENLN